MKLLRASCFSLALAGAAASIALVPTDAKASVMIAVGFDALVKDADAVAVVTAQDANSLWEDGRIVTYTRVKVEEKVAGDAPQEVWVRTLGGVVGKVGQLVDGEPVFTPKVPMMLFLRKFRAGGTWEVSARAQGQFPVVVDQATNVKKIIRNANAGLLVPPKQQPNAVQDAKLRLAGEVLHDRPVAEATKEIAAAWKLAHTAATK